MQNPQPPATATRNVRPGQYVRARGARWRVVDVRAYDACQLVTLRGLGPPHQGIQRRLLTPFDTLAPIERIARPRIVKRTRWRRACRALLAANTPPGGLRAALHARIDLLPHQLEPALAILRGFGSRALLADEVGLGKTIQAGLVAAELLIRAHVDRLLVVVPAGLRDQWIHELRDRFCIEATSADAVTLRQMTAAFRVGINPWSMLGAAVASIDYLKRSEVLPAAAACRWDLVIVDEAHGVAGDSDRQAAVQSIAARAPYVLLLTATPHSGDRRSFAALCALGELDADPLLIFRRTRAQVRIGSPRRVTALHVRIRAGERRMHVLLQQYSAAIRAELGERRHAWLALAVLHKRAFSSAASLALSLERRLATLSDPENRELQLGLPLDDPSGDLTSADAPPAWPAELRLKDPRRERDLLAALVSAAQRAAAAESKIAALHRLLRRTHESAVVFTEYRDTLEHVSRRLALRFVMLHGGLSAAERAAALATFTQTPGTVLLATDAAGEGLNLHHTCRLVINLELPWNPMRLEQRIGRVDRIGQSRTVHAVHLIARGTGESRILSRLHQRLAIARSEIGAPNPLGEDHDEQAVARWLLCGGGDDNNR
jgi:SNF2 family DNA or RNA helicase